MEAVPRFPSLRGELDADVLIVGAGVAGLTLAHALIEQDAMVGILEAGGIADGTSGRSAGILAVAPPEPYAELIALWGRQSARAMLEIGRRSHRRIRGLVEEFGIACDYAARGGVRLARTTEEAQDLRASLPLMRADGFVSREVPVSSEVPPAAAGRFVAAFVTPEDGELHPVRFLSGLAMAAAGRGGRLHTHSALEEACCRAGLWEARTRQGLARARTLVIACNAFVPTLCPALGEVIRPRRAQMLATAPLSSRLVARPARAHWGYQHWRQTGDLRLLIGGWRDLDPDGETGFDRAPTERIQRGIEEGLRELVPGGVRIEHRWAGTMGFARDGRPLVGWLDPDHHLAICAGFTGNGLGTAAGCTQDLAHLLVWKRAPGISTFDPLRFASLRNREYGFRRLRPGMDPIEESPAPGSPGT